MDRKSLSYIKWKCQYYIVFVSKYRKKTLYGQLQRDVREIIITLCKYKGVDSISGALCADLVHLCVSFSPKISISHFMSY